jgi:hypothetical protein
MTRSPHRNPQLLPQTFTLLTLFGLCALASSSLADPLPSWQPQHLPVSGVRPGELDVQSLRDRLRRAVFRVEAQHVPPPPYRPDPLVYDGALIAIEAPPSKDLPPDAPPPERKILLLSAAAWLAQAQTVTLVAGQDRWPLKIERLDHTLDLALLSAPDGLPPGLEPVALYDADGLPTTTYTLLSPQHPYEQFAVAHILGQAPDADRYYVLTDLGATSGYPLLDAQAKLVAIQSRRPAGKPSARSGLAIPLAFIKVFLQPPAPIIERP